MRSHPASGGPLRHTTIHAAFSLTKIPAGPTALLMQLADPKLAEIIARSSSFRGDPSARAIRTMASRLAFRIGTPEQRRDAGHYMGVMHARVRAENPEVRENGNLLWREMAKWIDATVIYAGVAARTRLEGRRSVNELEAAYQAAADFSAVGGLPRRLRPPSYDAHRRYIGEKIPTLEVSETARRLAVDILHPRIGLFRDHLPAPIAGALENSASCVITTITAHLLPPSIARQYGLDPEMHPWLESTVEAVSKVLHGIPHPDFTTPLAHHVVNQVFPIAGADSRLSLIHI